VKKAVLTVVHSLNDTIQSLIVDDTRFLIFIMGNGSSANLTIGRFQNLTGQFKDVADHRIDLSVYRLKENERFPCFYYDYGNHREKVLNWLHTIRSCSDNSNYPFPPLAIMDPPKAGKTALLHLLPHMILEIYPKCKIIHIDFAQFALNLTDVQTDEMEPFSAHLLRGLSNACQTVGINIDFQIASNDATIKITEAFQIINKWLVKKGTICFMLWDEVQRWFQLNNFHAAALFDQLTLHQSFTNIAFVITGSGIVQIFNSILSFPSNGTFWSSSATFMSLYPGVENDSEEGLDIKTQLLDDNIGRNMVILLKHFHGEYIPDNVLDFIPDKSPAIVSYFCELHQGKESTPREMKRTLGRCYEKLFNDFKRDVIPVLKTLSESDKHLFNTLGRIASSTLLIGELHNLDVLCQWKPVFESLLRCKEVRGSTYVMFAGYYGYLFVRSIDSSRVDDSGNFRLITLRNFNKLPVPALWATVSLVHGLWEFKSFELRVRANTMSAKIFREFDLHLSDPMDWVSDPTYRYFYILNANDMNATVVNPSEDTPYLDLLKFVRNSVSHIRSLPKIAEISNNMPECLNKWIRELLLLAIHVEP
jgi:hypothetical protein